MDFKILPEDREFKDSPDREDPNYTCSRCGKKMKSVCFRLFTEHNTEFRFCNGIILNGGICTDEIDFKKEQDDSKFFYEMDIEMLDTPENMPKATGTVLDEHGEHWKVDCPKCGKELEYEGFFDPSYHYECKCGCEFLTTKIFFENGDFLD